MSYCKNCGQQLRDNDKFCPDCGTQVGVDDSLVPKSKSLAPNDYRGPKVRLCEDGKYRWVYEMSFLTNPTIFLTVFKVFACIIIGMFWFLLLSLPLTGIGKPWWG